MPRKFMVSPVRGPVRQMPQSPRIAALIKALPRKDSYPVSRKTQAQNTLLSCYDGGIAVDLKSAINFLMKWPFHLSLARVFSAYRLFKVLAVTPRTNAISAKS